MNKLIKLSKNVCTVYIIRVQTFVKTWSCRNAYLCFYSIIKRKFFKYNRGDIIRKIVGISVFFIQIFLNRIFEMKYLYFPGKYFLRIFQQAFRVSLKMRAILRAEQTYKVPHRPHP